MKWVKNAVEWCTAVVFGTMVLVTFLQVVARYIFNSPLSWSEELARYLFIWTTLLAAALAVQRGVHMGMDILLKSLPPRVQAVLSLFNHLVITAFLLYLAAKGYQVATQVMNAKSVALEVPMGWLYLAVPVGAVLMVVFNLSRVRNAALALFRPNPEGAAMGPAVKASEAE